MSMLRSGLLTLCVLAAFAGRSEAQLAPDAVLLDKVKIPETIKSADLCPVTLEPANPKLGTWTYQGVVYRGSTPEAVWRFIESPAKYAEAAAKERFIRNFMQAMSIVWCPVTDEISPGGMTQWVRLGYTWESCCAFCDETVDEQDFGEAIKRLRARADKCYALIGAKYTASATSPVEGAIKQSDTAP